MRKFASAARSPPALADEPERARRIGRGERLVPGVLKNAREEILQVGLVLRQQDRAPLAGARQNYGRRDRPLPRQKRRVHGKAGAAAGLGAERDAMVEEAASRCEKAPS